MTTSGPVDHCLGVAELLAGEHARLRRDRTELLDEREMLMRRDALEAIARRLLAHCEGGPGLRAEAPRASSLDNHSCFRRPLLVPSAAARERGRQMTGYGCRTRRDSCRLARISMDSAPTGPADTTPSRSHLSTVGVTSAGTSRGPDDHGVPDGRGRGTALDCSELASHAPSIARVRVVGRLASPATSSDTSVGARQALRALVRGGEVETPTPRTAREAGAAPDDSDSDLARCNTPERSDDPRRDSCLRARWERKP